MKTLLLILILSVTHISLAQLDLATIAGDRSKLIRSFTDQLNNVCDQNKIKLDRQKLQELLEIRQSRRLHMASFLTPDILHGFLTKGAPQAHENDVPIEAEIRFSINQSNLFDIPKGLSIDVFYIHGFILRKEAQIESCVKPHVEKIVGIATDGRSLGQIMGALRNQPITFSSEQRTWIKTEILSPACKIFSCVNPIKNPLTQECMSEGNAVSKVFNYTNLYFDAICKNEGENFLALIESVNQECAQEYPSRLQSCAQKDAGFPTMRDGKLNITVTEMCGVLAKVHTCSISSVNVCGPEATQVFQNTFKDLQTWVTTSCDDSSENNQGSQSQPILGFMGMILSVFLAGKIGIHLR